MQKRLFFYFIGLLIASTTLGCEGCQKQEPEIQTEPETITQEEKTTQNGFKYIHHIQNEGPKPQAGEYAYYNLEIYGMIDSLGVATLLESSEQFMKISPFEETKGFTNPIIDVMYMMSIGDSITVKMPAEDAASWQKGYEGFSYINFKVKLFKLTTPAEHSKTQIDLFNNRKEKLIQAQAKLKELTASWQKNLADYKAGKLGTLPETKSGIKYIIHQEGKGNNLKNGNIVSFFYSGLLMDGTIFDNTIESGAGSSIQIGRGQSLPAWEEAMTYLKYGSKVTLFVPYQMAYGEQGVPPKIPPKAEVMFYMELIE